MRGSRFLFFYSDTLFPDDRPSQTMDEAFALLQSDTEFLGYQRYILARTHFSDWVQEGEEGPRGSIPWVCAKSSHLTCRAHKAKSEWFLNRHGIDKDAGWYEDRFTHMTVPRIIEKRARREADYVSASRVLVRKYCNSNWPCYTCGSAASSPFWVGILAGAQPK